VRGEVRGTVAGLRVWLVTDGEDLQSWEFAGDRGVLEWRDARPLTTTRYYYLRVRQSDGHLGWTSPVWIVPQSSSASSEPGGIE
jgi:predicted dehydrogenase